jgi:hypothetical protein
MKYIKRLLTSVLLLGTLFLNGSAYADNAPVIRYQFCTEAGLQGQYSLVTKIITICYGLSAQDEAETIQHELVHYYQDKADGLDNTTLTTVSGDDIVQTLWDNNDYRLAGLKAHITENYHPSHYLYELEAYILQNYPTGYVLSLE